MSIEKSKSNTFQTLYVLIGSLSSFVFSIVSSMLLSRYFSKGDYGMYKQVMYIYNTLLVVFTLGLPKAYSFFLPRVPIEEAKGLINRINIFLLTLGLILSLLIFTCSGIISSLFNKPHLNLLLKYFALVPLFMVPTMGIEAILSVYKKTQFLAIFNILSRIFMLLSVVLPVILLKGDVYMAIIGFTFSSFVAFIFAIYFKYLPFRGIPKRKPTVKFKEILGYIIPLFGASIWGILISSTDQFFITKYFSNEVFADFANGSMELPFVSMIVSATSIVLSPVFSKLAFSDDLESKNEIFRVWQSVFGKTVKIIYPLVFFCIFFAEQIMVVMYGHQYFTSGTFFQIKLFVNFFTLIVYGPLLISIGGQKFYYNVHMFGAIILIALEYLAIILIGSPIAIIVVSVICQIGRILVMMNYIANFFKISLFKLFPYKLILEISIPCISFLLLIKFGLTSNMIISPILILIIGFVTYLIIFSFWARIRRIEYADIFLPFFKKFRK